MTNTTDKLLTARDVAKRLGVCYLTALTMIHNKRIKAFRLNGNGKTRSHWRIKEEELEAFINKVNNSEISN